MGQRITTASNGNNSQNNFEHKDWSNFIHCLNKLLLSEVTGWVRNLWRWRMISGGRKCLQQSNNYNGQKDQPITLLGCQPRVFHLFAEGVSRRVG